MALLIDGAGEEVLLGLGERRLFGRRVAQHRVGRGGHLRVREQLVRVVAERLADLILELRHVSAVPGSWGGGKRLRNVPYWCLHYSEDSLLTLEYGRDQESSAWISLPGPSLSGSLFSSVYVCKARRLA